MAVSPTPSSQKADERPIAFVLDDQSLPGAPLTAVTLAIRPEELSRTQPSRLGVHHTFGGAFVDSFGPGVGSITLAGHTGWPRLAADSGARDGQARFEQLYEQVFTRWHSLRNLAVQDGRDPTDVKLIFVDVLDNITVEVAPQSFNLRRSKSRPLLCAFQIQLAVLGDAASSYMQAKEDQFSAAPEAAKERSALASLLDSIRSIIKFARDLKGFIDRTLIAPLRAFMELTASIYTLVKEAVSSVVGVVSSLASLATLTAQAGANIFRSIGALLSLPQSVRQRLREVAAVYTNVFCVLRNALKPKTHYLDYEPLYGASNCSST